jgi:hypothetical protein
MTTRRKICLVEVLGTDHMQRTAVMVIARFTFLETRTMMGPMQVLSVDLMQLETVKTTAFLHIVVGCPHFPRGSLVSYWWMVSDPSR